MAEDRIKYLLAVGFLFYSRQFGKVADYGVAAQGTFRNFGSIVFNSFPKNPMDVTIRTVSIHGSASSKPLFHVARSEEL